MSKVVALLISGSNIAKAEIFAFFNVILLTFWLIDFLTSTSVGEFLHHSNENWDGLLGFFMSYLMPMFMGVLLLDGVRHKNQILCKLWLIYQLTLLMGCGVILFIVDTTFQLSSRKLILILSSVLFKATGMWIILDFLRELNEFIPDYAVPLNV